MLFNKAESALMKTVHLLEGYYAVEKLLNEIPTMSCNRWSLQRLKKNKKKNAGTVDSLHGSRSAHSQV